MIDFNYSILELTESKNYKQKVTNIKSSKKPKNSQLDHQAKMFQNPQDEICEKGIVEKLK